MCELFGRGMHSAFGSLGSAHRATAALPLSLMLMHAGS